MTKRCNIATKPLEGGSHYSSCVNVGFRHTLLTSQSYTRLGCLTPVLNTFFFLVVCFALTVYGIDSSPGPQYFVDAKVTRFGRDGTPAYSMLGRMRKTGDQVDRPVKLSPSVSL